MRAVNYIFQQIQCSVILATLLCEDEQFDAAEETASHAMDLSENHDQYLLGKCHYLLGGIQRSKGNREKAIHHFEASLRIASVRNSHDKLSRIHLSLADLHLEEDRFGDAQVHIEHAKSRAGDDMFLMGCAFYSSARVLSARNAPEEAKSEASRALAIFEKLGATELIEATRGLLEEIGE